MKLPANLLPALLLSGIAAATVSGAAKTNAPDVSPDALVRALQGTSRRVDPAPVLRPAPDPDATDPAVLAITAETNAVAGPVPADEPPVTAQGFALLIEGDRVGALRRFQTATNREPLNAHAHFRLGNALDLSTDHAGAAAAYRRAALLSPGNADPWLLLCHALRRAGDAPRAIEAGLKAVEHRPSAGTWAALALAHHAARDNASEIEAWRNAVGIRSDFPAAWYNLGLAMMARGTTINAIIALKNARLLDPHHADTWNHLALLFRRKGDHRSSSVAYVELLKRKPRDAAAWRNLGAVYEEAGAAAPARQAYAKAAALEAETPPQTPFDIAAAQQAAGKLGEAADTLRALVKEQPAHAEAWNNLGALEIDLRHPDAAIEALNNAIAANPLLADAWYNIGAAYDAKGETVSAIAAYRKALELRPDFAEARRRLEEAGEKPAPPPEPAPDSLLKALGR